MRVFLVRHGESTNNAQKTHQGGDSVLSEKGLNQAQFIADRFLEIPIDLLLSSPHTRASQTAEKIAETKNLPIEFSELLTERKRPSSFLEKPYDDPETVLIKHQIDTHPNPSYQYEDEETFTQLKDRTQAILEFLRAKPQQSIAVATHGVLIKALIGQVLFGSDFTKPIFNRLFNNLKIHNTGITELEYKEGKWSIVTINDKAHLP